MTFFNRREAMLASLAWASFGHALAAEGTFPSKPMRIVVPFGAGGTTDAMSRRLAQELQARLGQPVITENRPGGGGGIGAMAALAPPQDGHTLLLTSTSLVQAPLLNKTASYDPLQDFTPLAMLCSSSVVVAVPVQLNVRTMKELIAYVKANPGRTSYGSAGIGTTGHVWSEELKRRHGLDTAHVPYSGDAKLVTDLLTNRVQWYIGTPSLLSVHADAGKLRLLAVTGHERIAFLPQVPTFAEAGLPGFETMGWFGVFVAAKAPAEVRQFLKQEVTRIVQTPEFSAFLTEIRMSQPLRSDFEPEVRKAQVNWTRLIRDNNVKAD